ncbi:RebB family R body protein [Maricaulis maris]|uniref:Killing trait domain-containing protein n=1 Tax=Maricaulis maris TaxID=74318 RepID=A0A495DMP4_9PROT|nr:RebB family R body protein [Maricaulis maris]RKR04165.1 killing trait domain-containing protein [Maricaulis maris]
MTRAFALILAVPATLGLSIAAEAQDAVPAGTVNSQVDDSISQTNTEVLGNAPASSMGNQSFAEPMSAELGSAHNATSGQQNANTVLQATTTQGVQLLAGFGAAAEDGNTGDGEGDPDN